MASPWASRTRRRSRTVATRTACPSTSMAPFFNAVVAEGVTRPTAGPADSVTFCLSKGLACRSAPSWSARVLHLAARGGARSFLGGG